MKKSKKTKTKKLTPEMCPVIQDFRPVHGYDLIPKKGKKTKPKKKGTLFNMDKKCKETFKKFSLRHGYQLTKRKRNNE